MGVGFIDVAGIDRMHKGEVVSGVGRWIDASI